LASGERQSSAQSDLRRIQFGIHRRRVPAIRNAVGHASIEALQQPVAVGQSLVGGGYCIVAAVQALGQRCRRGLKLVATGKQLGNYIIITRAHQLTFPRLRSIVGFCSVRRRWDACNLRSNRSLSLRFIMCRPVLAITAPPHDPAAPKRATA
jgi:hypothetical protein